MRNEVCWRGRMRHLDGSKLSIRQVANERCGRDKACYAAEFLNGKCSPRPFDSYVGALTRSLVLSDNNSSSQSEGKSQPVFNESISI